VGAFQKQTPGHPDAKITKVFANMKQMLGLYEPIFCILGVTSSHAENAPGGKVPDVTGAHAAVFFLPRDYYTQCVANWSTQHPVAQRVIGQHRTISDQLGHLEQPLPILVGEGTGIMEPGARTDPCLAQRKLVAQCPGTNPGQIKKMLYNGPAGSSSSFYKVLIFGASPAAAARGERTLTWRFAQRQADGEYSKGIRFEQLMVRDPSICLVPYGGTAYGLADQLERNVHELSHKELQHLASGFGIETDALFESQELTVGRAVADVKYKRSFKKGGYTTRDFHGHAKWHRELRLGDVVSEATEGEEFTDYQSRVMANVAKTRAGGRRNCEGTHVVHEFLHPDQLEQPKLLRSIAQHVRQNQAQIVGFDYTYEWHSEALQAWRLNFYCTF
jgi:hypothetical protein